MVPLTALLALTVTAQAETASVGLFLRKADSLMTGVQATITPPGPLQIHTHLLGRAGPTPDMAIALRQATGEADIVDGLGWTELELRLLPSYRVWGAKSGDNGPSVALGIDAIHQAFPGRTDSLGAAELTVDGPSNTRIGAHARLGLQLDLLGMGATLGQELTGFFIGGGGLQARTKLRLNLGLPWVELGLEVGGPELRPELGLGLSF
jgi:hypothetical protein